MSFPLHQARFFTTVNHLRDLPRTSVPEVAFAGRSNAGKSTAINTLCNQKRLAFASKTPGRTQHINYFSIDGRETTLAYLVDLPGYGYAQVGGDVKYHWGHLMGEYIQTRPQLAGLILMMDARRPFTELDHQMVEWFLPTAKPLHILLTKADKLNRSESMLALSTARKLLNGYAEQLETPVLLTVQLFSSLKRTGIDEASALIRNWLELPTSGTQTSKKTPSCKHNGATSLIA